MEYMKKRIDVAKIISNLISAPICFGQKRKIVRKKIYRLLSKEHISCLLYTSDAADEL